MVSKVGTTKKQKLASFRYKAYDRRGKVVKGTIKATNEIAAERLIASKGLNPTSVEVAPSMFSLEEAFPSLFKIKPRDVIVFSRQLAILLKSGISLLPALEILEDQVATSRAFNRILQSITADLRGGVSFSQALAKHTKAFSDIYCRTISVGEQTGEIIEVLQRMADYEERRTLMAKKIGKALVYPMMVVGIGLAVVVLLIVVVMPNLIDMFTAMSADLPLPTRILIGLTEFVTGNALYLIIAGSVFGATLVWMLKQSTGKRLFDRMMLHTPLIGSVTLMSELGRFSRTVSTLVSAGMSLQQIMEMAPICTNNQVFRDALSQLRDKLYLGEGLSEPMSHMDLFPPLLTQMVAVGEESNTLDFTLGVVADFCETTAEEKAATLVGLIGPISTIGIALLVGFIAMSVIMPMYTLTGAFG